MQQTLFYWPAEWEPHQATWIAFPANRSLWEGDFFEAEASYAAVANRLSEFEAVRVAVTPQNRARVEKLLSKKISLHELPFEDGWIRDLGPIFVRSRKTQFEKGTSLRALSFRFNGWGGRFTPFENNQRIAARVAALEQVPVHSVNFVLEGGAIHGDGAGTLLTTKECLLNPNRGPEKTSAELTAALYQTLGAKKVLWLSAGLVDDHTDGHVDNVAAFVAPGIVAALVSSEPQERNHSRLQANLRRLEESEDCTGRRIRVEPIAAPPEKYHRGRQLPRSYLNFYIANGAVLVPTFGERQDQPALEKLAALFPKRELIPLPGEVLTHGGGGIHCITQQVPAITSTQP